MGMNRKIKKAQEKKDQNLGITNEMLDYMKANLGVSENVGDREPFSSGRITERVGDKRPTEDQLLQQFSKTKLEEDFSKMTKFSELYAEFDELFTNDIQAIKLDFLNDTWSEDKIAYYFTEMEDTCLDLMNNMCDLASYAKNKEYKTLQDRILEASKVFNPRMIGIYTSFKENPSNMSEIILKIRAVQGRYASGAAFQASQKKKPVSTIEERTYAILEYNDSMKALSSNPMYAMSNTMINEAKPKNQKKKIEAIAANYINDDSIPPYCPVMNAGKKQTEKQAKKLCNIYSDLEDKLEVLQSFLNEDQTFNFEKAKQVFKESGSSFGSVELYLENLKSTFDEILSVNRSLFELYIADQIINKSITVKTVMEDYGFDFDLGTYEETYQGLLEAIKLTTGHFYMFAQRKSLSWINDTEVRKTNTKLLKEIEKYGLDRVVERPTRKKVEISDAAAEQFYKEKGIDIERVEEVAEKIEEIENWVNKRDYIFTPSHFDLGKFYVENKNEEARIAYLRKYDLIYFTDKTEVDIYLGNLFALKADYLKSTKAETEKTFIKKSHEFFIKMFDREAIENKIDPETAYQMIRKMIADALLVLNNLISVSKFAIEFKEEKLLKFIIDTVNTYLEKNDIEGNMNKDSIITFFEDLSVGVVPQIIVYATAKDLPFYSLEDWKKLNKSYNKNKEKFFKKFVEEGRTK